MNLHAIRFKSLEELKSFQICVLSNYFAVFPRWKAYNSGLVTSVSPHVCSVFFLTLMRFRVLTTTALRFGLSVRMPILLLLLLKCLLKRCRDILHENTKSSDVLLNETSRRN